MGGRTQPNPARRPQLAPNEAPPRPAGVPANAPQGDQAPFDIGDEDDQILDRVWAKIVADEEAKNRRGRAAGR